jgi:hypothetical protein
MATTYEKIATTTLGSATATITFSSIASTYTDLVLVLVPKYVSTTATKLTINSDTTTNYSITWLYGDGSTAGSFRLSNEPPVIINYFNNTSAQSSMNIVNFQNYANTSVYKTVLFNNSNADVGTDSGVILYRSTSAINNIKLSPATGNYDTGTTATLYGILKA